MTPLSLSLSLENLENERGISRSRSASRDLRFLCLAFRVPSEARLAGIPAEGNERRAERPKHAEEDTSVTHESKSNNAPQSCINHPR